MTFSEIQHPIIKPLTKDELNLAFKILQTCDFSRQIFNPDIPKKSVLELYSNSFTEPDSDLMGLFHHGQLKAVWILFHDEKSLFATITYGVFTLDSYKNHFASVLCWLMDNYPNYRIILGVRTSNETADQLLSKKAKLLMEAKVYKWKLDQEDRVPFFISPLKKDEFLQIADWYDQEFPDIYWNSTNVLNNYEQWLILSKELNHGYSRMFFGIWCNPDKKIAEIFTSKIAPNDLKDFLSAIKFYCHKNGANELIWIVEQKSEEDLALINLGYGTTEIYKEFKLL